VAASKKAIRSALSAIPDGLCCHDNIEVFSSAEFFKHESDHIFGKTIIQLEKPLSLSAK